MRLHADAVAEDSAACVGACWIDGDNAHRLLRLAILPRKLVNQSALACSGGAGQSYHMRFSAQREQSLQQLNRLCCRIFDRRDGTRDRADVASADAVYP